MWKKIQTRSHEAIVAILVKYEAQVAFKSHRRFIIVSNFISLFRLRRIASPSMEIYFYCLAVSWLNKKVKGKRSNTNRCKSTSDLDHQSFLFISSHLLYKPVCIAVASFFFRISSFKTSHYKKFHTANVNTCFTVFCPVFSHGIKPTAASKKGALVARYLPWEALSKHYAAEHAHPPYLLAIHWARKIPLLCFLLIILILNYVCPAASSQFLVWVLFRFIFLPAHSEVRVHEFDTGWHIGQRCLPKLPNHRQESSGIKFTINFVIFIFLCLFNCTSTTPIIISNNKN